MSGLFVNKLNLYIFARFFLHIYNDLYRFVFDNLDLKFLRNSQAGILVFELMLSHGKP